MKSTIILAGQKYMVTVENNNGRIKRFIDNEEISVFIERMTLLRRTDVLADLVAIGKARLDGALTFNSPQQTAFELHQARTRSN